MDKSIIFELFESEMLRKWRDQIETKDECEFAKVER